MTCLANCAARSLLPLVVFLAAPGMALAADAPDPLSVDPDLAIWTAIVFGVVLVILWKFAWGPITLGLQKREKAIADNVAAAEEAAAEAHRLTEQYEKKLAEAAAEVRAMIEEARRDAEHTKSQIIAEAQAESAKETKRATREITLAKDAALEELGQLSANLAINLAGEIVRRELKPDDHAELIRQAMSHLPHQPSRN